MREDPVVKFKQVIRVIKKEDGKEEDCSYAYAIRQSGLIDLYWNYTLTSSPEGNLNIELNFTVRYVPRCRSDLCELLLEKVLHRVRPRDWERRRSHQITSYPSQQ